MKHINRRKQNNIAVYGPEMSGTFEKQGVENWYKIENGVFAKFKLELTGDNSEGTCAPYTQGQSCISSIVLNPV